jgi:anti-sigma B factor antagonist
VDLAIEIGTVCEGVTLVRMKGRIDLYTAPLLRDCLSNLIGKGNLGLVANLAAVGFLGLTGRQILAAEQDHVRSYGGFLWLVGPPRRTTAFWKELDSSFTTFDTEEAARQHFTEHIMPAHGSQDER